MTKSDLVAGIVERTGTTKGKATEMVNAFTSIVTEELSRGGSVVLTGFGSFETRTREEHDGRNPSTGEKIHIPERKSVKFKAGSNLRTAVNA